MKKNTAMVRYLQRHIEGGLPDPPPHNPSRWRDVVVLPCFDESPQLLRKLAAIKNAASTLIIIVLNRPDSCSNRDVNAPLRAAIAKLAKSDTGITGQQPIYNLARSLELYCYDLERLKGPSCSSQGVGLARKLGCDIALHWQAQGAITGNWICSTDADATLPTDYFYRLPKANEACAAVTYPFRHTLSTNPRVNAATTLYELKLHHYVLGLQYARSPYAYHTLGSCIAVRTNYYAQVRGYPKRSAGEDFYLLNKLAKIAPVAQLSGECIALESRTSHRVPFGTGPATQHIMNNAQIDNAAIFYHPQCFEALRAVLAVIEILQRESMQQLPLLLKPLLDCKPLRNACVSTLNEMGLELALKHCRKQGNTTAQFRRQFDQWFDGFRTLKFIHALREQGWNMQTLGGVSKLTPSLFPDAEAFDGNAACLRPKLLQKLKWTSDCLEYSDENSTPVDPHLTDKGN